MKNIYLFIYFLFSSFKTQAEGDLIINEIFYNPNNSPLSNAEFIEIYNNSDKNIDLADYVLQVNNTLYHFAQYRIASKQYVILTNTAGSQNLERYGNVVTVNSWPTLANTSATINLLKDNKLIDQITYHNNWHSSSHKRNGGWSLERINPNWNCNLQDNWASSTHPMGATPGKRNSAYNYQFAPQLQVSNYNFLDNKITITLNTPISLLNNLQVSNFVLSDLNESPTSIEVNNDDNSLILTFSQTIQQQKNYILTIKNLHICNLAIRDLHLTLFEQGETKYNHILINEILFNPKDAGNDFVELYNNTNLPINLQYWRLNNRIISNELLILYPKDFLAITIDKETLIKQYSNADTQKTYQINSMINYANHQGTVILTNQLGTLIDSLYYNTNMHHPLLTNVKGISLERQSYNKPTNAKENFKSASTIIGGATPGRQNSSNVENFFKKDEFFLSSKIVTPNNDFQHDFLEINYQFTSADYVLSISIYDDKGRLIKRLISQQKVGDNGKILWDCKDDFNKNAPSNHYILLAELIHPNGQIKTFKEAFIISR